MRARPLYMRWTPLPPELAPAGVRLQAALEAWRRTPYASGQRCRGVAADCIGSCCGVVDDVDGRPRAQAAALPPDTALHDPKTSRAAVAALRRLYAPAQRLRQVTRDMLRVQPGDLLVVGTSAGGPGHLMIVGAQPNTLWHSTVIAGFHQGGWALGDGYERIFAVYRLGDRERWVR